MDDRTGRQAEAALVAAAEVAESIRTEIEQGRFRGSAEECAAEIAKRIRALIAGSPTAHVAQPATIAVPRNVDSAVELLRGIIRDVEQGNVSYPDEGRALLGNYQRACGDTGSGSRSSESGRAGRLERRKRPSPHYSLMSLSQRHRPQ